MRATGTIAIVAAIACLAAAAEAQQNTILPDVTVTAPVSPPVAPPRSQASPGNPYFGNYRVEETKWPDIPRTASRIGLGATGACKRGPPMETFEKGDANGGRQQSNCNISHDLTAGAVGALVIEAEVLVFDPYYVSGLGHQRQDCYVHRTPGDLRENFYDMNQMARQGTGWRNFVEDGDQSTMQFTTGPDECLAVQKRGPRWGGGMVWLMQFTVCRKDRRPVDAGNVATVLGMLQVKERDPNGNLRQ